VKLVLEMIAELNGRFNSGWDSNSSEKLYFFLPFEF
jgi:hypothetical protein